MNRNDILRILEILVQIALIISFAYFAIYEYPKLSECKSDCEKMIKEKCFKQPIYNAVNVSTMPFILNVSK